MLWTVVLKTLESPLDCQEIKPVIPRGNQPHVFIGRFDAEVPILWPPNVKNWLIGKNPDAGKDWRWEEKGMIKDEMVQWHHQLDGYEFEQALGVGDEQETRHAAVREVAMTEQLNWTLITPLWFLYSSTWICVWLGNLGETCLELYSRNECSRGHPLGTGQMWVDGEFWPRIPLYCWIIFFICENNTIMNPMASTS